MCAFLSGWCCVSKPNAGEPSCNSSASAWQEGTWRKSLKCGHVTAYVLPVVLVNLGLLSVEFLMGSGLGKTRQGLGSGISPPEQSKWEAAPRDGLWLVVGPAMWNPTASFLGFLYLLIYLLCLSHDVALNIHICSNQASPWTPQVYGGGQYRDRPPSPSFSATQPKGYVTEVGGFKEFVVKSESLCCVASLLSNFDHCQGIHPCFVASRNRFSLALSFT